MTHGPVHLAYSARTQPSVDAPDVISIDELPTFVDVAWGHLPDYWRRRLRLDSYRLRRMLRNTRIRRTQLSRKGLDLWIMQQLIDDTADRLRALEVRRQRSTAGAGLDDHITRGRIVLQAMRGMRQFVERAEVTS